MKDYKLISLQKNIQSIICDFLTKNGYIEVTILEVDIDKSLSRAKVYYSTLYNAEEKFTNKFITELRKQIAFIMGNKMRRVPVIMMVYDDTSSKAASLEETLKRIKDEKK